MDESLLPGGSINQVVPVGTAVRRGTSSPYVRELLGLFEERGWNGAPRYRDVDERGREMPGHVAGGASAELSDAGLARVAELVREFHDLTAGSTLAGTGEVVCHNDLAPKSTICAADGGDWLPVAFTDWDMAAPGERVHDVAHVCWRYLDLGPGVRDVADAARRITLVCDAYGLDDRDGIVRTILWSQDRCRRSIEAGAGKGEPALPALREPGVVDEIRAAYTWVSAHAFELAAQL